MTQLLKRPPNFGQPSDITADHRFHDTITARIMTPVRGPMHLVDRVDANVAASRTRLGDGWAFDVAGNCGSSGERAMITFVVPYRPHHARLRLQVRRSRDVRLIISVNGWLIGRSTIGPDKAPDSCLDYWIPKEAMTASRLEFTITSSPAPAMAGPAFFLTAATLEAGPETPTADPGADTAALMCGFENLGGDCEFGFVQRHFGAEPVGIFRFATCHHLTNLLHLIETDLEGMGAPGSLVARERDAHLYRLPQPPLVIREFMMEDPKLGYGFHTWRGPQDEPRELAISGNEQKLRYLRRKFLEDLEEGEKIWVLKTARRADINEAFAFHAALNRRARNKLFWVTRTIEGRPSGAVEWIGDGLLRGYSGQPHQDAQIFEPAVWLELCQKARRAFMESDLSGLAHAASRSAA